MSGDVFAYDESQARGSEEQIQATVNTLEQLLNELTGFVNQTKANWEGDEKETYAQIQSKWDASAADVREGIRQVREILNSTTESVGQMRGKVRGALQG